MAIFKLQFSPDNSQLLTCSADKTAREFNPSNGQQTRALQGHNDWVYVATFSQDAKLIATGSWDGEVRIWNAADGAAVKNFIAMPTQDNTGGIPVSVVPPGTVPATQTAISK